MAVYTLDLLIQGQQEIVEYYNNARQLWQQIRESEAFNNVDTLAQELTNRQLRFEKDCGGRWIGQEIMAIVGIGQFYSIEVGFDGNTDEAIKVKNAFAQSYCSIEVKYHAERAVEIFGLTENDEL
jgi:hypothetical protein